MAHRLTTSVRTIDRIILKSVLLTGKNKLAQVQPRHTELRQSLSQSSVYLSYEPPRSFHKTFSPKTGKNGGAIKMKGTGAEENIDKEKFKIASFTSPPNSTQKALNQDQDSKSDGNGSEGRERKKSSRGPVVVVHVDHERIETMVFYVLVSILGVIACITCLRDKSKKNYENQLARSRVEKSEVTEEECKNKPQKSPDEPQPPKGDKNCGATPKKTKRTRTKKNVQKITKKESFTSLSMSAPKALNQDSKSSVNGGDQGDGQKYSPGLCLYADKPVCGRYYRKKNYREISWEDLENLRLQGRVAKVEPKDQNWLLAHTAPGASTDDAETFQLRFDSFSSSRNPAPVTETLPMTVNKNEPLVDEQKKV